SICLSYFVLPYYSVFLLSCLSCFFYCFSDHRDLHSFPTRRSSDLALAKAYAALGWTQDPASDPDHIRNAASWWLQVDAFRRLARSEEHTSELQSRENLVCRLLLEKKNDISAPQGDYDQYYWAPADV